MTKGFKESRYYMAFTQIKGKRKLDFDGFKVYWGEEPFITKIDYFNLRGLREWLCEEWYDLEYCFKDFYESKNGFVIKVVDHFRYTTIRVVFDD